MIIQGFRYLPEVGLYISLTGCLLFGGLMIYSDQKYKIKGVYESDEISSLKNQLFNLILCLSWAPVAILYQSKLIGFLTVGAFFAFLGFTVVCRGMCWL